MVTAQDTGRVRVIVDYKYDADTVEVLVIPVPVASVALAAVDSLSLDDTVTFTATPLDSAHGPLEGRTVNWSSSAPSGRVTWS